MSIQRSICVSPGSLALLLVGLTLLPGLPVSAQQPTASLIALNGDVMVSVQGGSPTPGIVGTVLQEGDSIKTRAGATATVELSDRSTLELEENTAVSISVMTLDPATGASRSQLDLWWGSLRSTLPAGQMNSGSSITVQTSNARTDMGGTTGAEGAEGGDSQVIFDPDESVTTAIANKFDVVMTNLMTEESLLIPQGNVGLVQGNTVQQIAMVVTFPKGDDSLMDIIEAQGEGENTIKAQLDRIATILKQIPDRVIVIEGHTDNVGSPDANMSLGQSRAENVKQYFIEFHGIDPQRLEAVSYGMTRPVAPNDTAEGRAQNRRVEVH